MPATARTASDRQMNFLRTLADERRSQIDAMATGTGPMNEKAAWVLHAIEHGAHCPPNSVATSQAIDWLLSMPRDPRPVDITEQHIPSGRYAIVNADGSVSFYRVNTPQDGRWAGRTFVDRYASDDRIPVRDRVERTRVLDAIGTDPHGAMALYGREVGRCGNCGRMLTDETSREIGIGPDCCERLGIDRADFRQQVEARQTQRLAQPSTTAAPLLTADAESGEDDGVASWTTFAKRSPAEIAQTEREYAEAYGR